MLIIVRHCRSCISLLPHRIARDRCWYHIGCDRYRYHYHYHYHHVGCDRYLYPHHYHHVDCDRYHRYHHHYHHVGCDWYRYYHLLYCITLIVTDIVVNLQRFEIHHSSFCLSIISNSSFSTKILLSKIVPYRVSSVTLATESVWELRFSFDHCKFLSFLRAALFCTLSGSARLLVIIIFTFVSFLSEHLYSKIHIILALIEAPLIEMSHSLFISLSSKHLTLRCRIIHFVIIEAPLLEMSNYSFRYHRSTSAWDVASFILFIKAHSHEMSNYSFCSSKHLHLRCRIIHFVYRSTSAWDVELFILLSSKHLH